ncbi:hypothetical protein PCL_06613 [Purpureocillium lilacinum]|uniref:Extracellular membrane protein CFEM domain-containing protein n=1 Tax=Purpureocillium lilacinum TaxID=33203 RepID=A0A2U3EN73_PURLI|nr:hypothetical protein PCL_06613 [Purpureocillium lilacinum]GJN76155.1 hypothetical protein PLICBS_010267 [Purpureocillium lilacinum]
MGRFAPLLIGALSALQMLSVAAQSADCIPQCSATTRSQFTKFACVNADDAGCLCAKADFFYGVRDCAVACGATEPNVRQALIGGFCPGLTFGATTAPAAPSTTAAPTTPTPTPTPEATTPATTTTSTTSSTSISASSVSETAQQTSTSASVSTTASATAESTSTASSTQTSAPSTTDAGIPASATSSQAAAGGSSNSGLSQAAVIGIGVGIGAAVIAIAGIVICLLLRNRKRRPSQHPHFEISKPLPGAGRTYASPDHGSFEKYHNDIELSSNRYEDMVPRTQPRTMV